MSSSWQTVDDMSTLLLYSPESSWRLDTNVQGDGVNGASTHTTSGDDTLVSVRFKGTAIIVYTYVRANSANFTAELDGESTFIQADSTFVNTTQPSATWGELEDTEHTLVLRKSRNHPDRINNVPGADLSYLSLDYFQIKGTLLPPPDAPPPTSGSSTSSNKLPTAAIIGIVLGSLAALLLFGAVAYVVSRRSRRIPEIDLEHCEDKSHPGTEATRSYQSTERNGSHISSGVALVTLPEPLARLQRPPPSPSHSHHSVHSTQSPQSPAPSVSPVSPALPALPAIQVPDEVRRVTDRSSGRGRASIINIPSYRQNQSGHRRASSGLLELPGHRFIRTGSPSKQLSSQTSSRISSMSRPPAGGYLSPSSSAVLSGISGPIIPSTPTPSYSQEPPQSPSFVTRSGHTTMNTPVHSSAMTFRTMAANAGSDLGDRSMPGSPVQSTIYRDLGDPNDGYEPPSSPVESSIIFPASTIASSCAVPTNQWS